MCRTRAHRVSHSRTPAHTGPGGANIEHSISPPSSLRGRSSAGPPRLTSPRQPRTCSRSPSSANLTELTSHARQDGHSCSSASRHRVRLHRVLDRRGSSHDPSSANLTTSRRAAKGGIVIPPRRGRSHRTIWTPGAYNHTNSQRREARPTTSTQRRKSVGTSRGWRTDQLPALHTCLWNPLNGPKWFHIWQIPLAA